MLLNSLVFSLVLILKQQWKYVKVLKLVVCNVNKHL